MKLPRQIKRRHPRGLWSAEPISDAQRVEREKRKLLERLSDPFGYEAFRAIRREAPHMFRGLSGNQPERGRFARALQTETDPNAARRGSPLRSDPKVLDDLFTFYEAARQMGCASLKDFLRKLIRHHYPRASSLTIERKTTELAQRLYEHRRQRALRRNLGK